MLALVLLALVLWQWLLLSSPRHPDGSMAATGAGPAEEGNQTEAEPQQPQQQQQQQQQQQGSPDPEPAIAAQLDAVVDVLAATGQMESAAVFVQAAATGHSRLVAAFLRRSGGDGGGAAAAPLVSLGDRQAALRAAACGGQLQCLQVLLGAAPGSSVAELVRGSMALQGAAGAGCLDCVELLLQACDPTEQLTSVDEQGCNAAMAAARFGRTACLERLLTVDPAAQLEAFDRDGNNALSLAAQAGDASSLALLLRHAPDAQVARANGLGRNALIYAVAGGCADSTALLLRHLPVEQVAQLDADAHTAAMFAVRQGRPDLLLTLLAHAPERQHLYSALMLAAYRWQYAQDRQQDEFEFDPDQLLGQPEIEGEAAVDAQQYRRCVELLLLKGARAVGQATSAAIAPIIQDLAARALAPDMARQAATAEAVVGLAAAVRGQRP